MKTPILLTLAALVAACAQGPQQGAPDAPSYAIAVASIMKNAESLRWAIETGITVGESCVAPVTPAQFRAFDEIAQRGELIGPPFSDEIYEVMVIRVQGTDGSVVGFGGRHNGLAASGLVYRLRDRDYEAAMKLADRVSNYPDCLKDGA